MDKQLTSLLRGMWEYRWQAMLTAWVVVIGGIIGVSVLPDQFPASARVFVDTQNTLKPLFSAMTTVPNVEQQVAIMSRTLLSKPNLERLVRMVDLDARAATEKDKEEVIEKLAREIEINGNVRDNIYTITYTSSNPLLAKNVVQSLLSIFVEGGIGGKRKDAETAIVFIDDQIRQYEEKLTSAENSLKEFKLKNIGLLSRDGGDYGSKTFEAFDALRSARLELREAEQARLAIQLQIRGGESGDPLALDQNNSEFEQQLQELQTKLETLQTQFTPAHPDVILTKRLIQQLQELKLKKGALGRPGTDPGIHISPLRLQLTLALTTADAKVASLRARVEELTNRVKRLATLDKAVPEIDAQLLQLNRDYQINKESYEKLLGRRESAKLSRELTATTDMVTFRVVDPPMVSATPTGPNRLRLLGAVLGGAIMAGLATAYLINQFRPTFLTEQGLQEATGLPVLGSVSKHMDDDELTLQQQKSYAFAAASVLWLLLGVGIISRAVMQT